MTAKAVDQLKEGPVTSGLFFNQYLVTAYWYGGEYWFKASEILNAIGDRTFPVDRLDRRLRCLQSTFNEYARPMTYMLNETGVYAVCIQSREPAAKKFKAWFCGEFMEPLRKLRDLDEHPTFAETLPASLSDAEHANVLKLLAEVQHYVEFAKTVQAAKGAIAVGELAKLIRQSTAIDMGQNRLYRWLRETGYVHSRGHQRNLPTQRSIENGWFQIHEATREDRHGDRVVCRTTRVTAKGQAYFVNLLRNQYPRLVLHVSKSREPSPSDPKIKISGTLV